MGSRKLVYQASTVLLVIIFTLVGTLKITPAVYPPVYNELKQDFGEFVRVFPVSLLKLEPAVYMLIVGVIEVTCAGLIILGKHPYAKLATWAIVIVMLGALYTHYSVFHPLSRCVPALVCLGLALARLYTMGALHQVEIKLKL